MKTILTISVVSIITLISGTEAWGWGGCLGLPPLCPFEAQAVCVDGGMSKKDFWICIKPSEIGPLF